MCNSFIMAGKIFCFGLFDTDLVFYGHSIEALDSDCVRINLACTCIHSTR